MKSQRGLTFSELMISITILGVITGGIFILMHKNQQRYKAEEDYVVAVQNARTTLDLISRYVRQAGNNPLSAVFDPLTYAGNTLTIRSDLTGSNAAANPLDSTGDPDGKLTAAYEQITVRYDSGVKQILLNVGYGEEVLADNINKLDLTFYNSSGAVVTDPKQANKISMTVEALSSTADLQTKKPNAITLSTTVYVRSKTITPFS